MSINIKDKNSSNTSKFSPIRISILSITIIIILAIIFAVYKSASSDNDSDIENPYGSNPTLLFGDTTVEVNTDIPQNTLTSDDFTADASGLLTYDKGNGKYGIDVSAFQDSIDWVAVKDSGIDFAIIRLGYRGMSEGLLYTDDYFYENLAGAKAVGIDIGVYFFSQAVTTYEAKEEAEYVLNILDTHKLQYPIFFDWEPGYDDVDRTKPLHDSPAVNDFALEFCKTVENKGYKSGIYFNSYQGYLQYDLSLFSSQCLWLAEYDSYPEFYYAFDMWQYTPSGSIDGVSTPVDMNIYFTDN